MSDGGRLPMVYVAGPISSNPMHCTNEALRLGAELLDTGLMLPFIPHVSVLWDIVAPRGYEEWMAYDFGIIRHCQALLRMEGHSPGADREVDLAASLGIPVFHNSDDLVSWCASPAYPGLPRGAAAMLTLNEVVKSITDRECWSLADVLAEVRRHGGDCGVVITPNGQLERLERHREDLHTNVPDGRGGTTPAAWPLFLTFACDRSVDSGVSQEGAG